jgi:hypothetical protein
MINYTYNEYYKGAKHDEQKLAAKRLEIVKSAKSIGIKPTARNYNVALNTVRKWLRRVDSKESVASLSNLSTRPKKFRNQLNYKAINKIILTTITFKQKGKVITANNIRRASKLKNLDCCDATINRYMNKALGNKSKKVKKAKNKSTKWKETIKPFQLIQVDIKYLTDIPNLQHLFRKNRHMPKYQITARDVATGYTWIAFANHKGVFETTKFIKTILIPFFKQHSLDMSATVIQTDNGKEFTNLNSKTLAEKKKTVFTKIVEENFQGHRTIKPGHCTANSDVESFHWTIERDFYGFEDFRSVEDFIAKSEQYINSYQTTVIKNRKASPKQMIYKNFGQKRIFRQKVAVMKYLDT